MATVYGANYTKVYQPIDGKPSMPAANEVGGRLRIWHDSYEAETLAASSTIYVAKLPALSRVYNVWVIADALGSGVQLEVGTVADPNQFITAAAMHTANKMLTMQKVDAAASGTGIAGVGVLLTAETDIVVTTNSGQTSSGTIQVGIIYSCD